MKPCDQWRSELIEHVLGAPASPALGAHLKECAACSSAQTEWRRRIGQIDAAIRQLAASEPSADSVARVMAEVHSRRPRRLWLQEWNRAAMALAGLVLVAASAVYFWKAGEQQRQTQRALSVAAAISSWRSPTQGLLRSPTGPWLNSVPRLGESFYEWKPNAPKKENDNL